MSSESNVLVEQKSDPNNMSTTDIINQIDSICGKFEYPTKESSVKHVRMSNSTLNRWRAEKKIVHLLTLHSRVKGSGIDNIRVYKCSQDMLLMILMDDKGELYPFSRLGEKILDKIELGV